MKKIPILILFVLLNSLLYAVDSDTIKADNPLVEYTGRIDFSNPLSPSFSYSGVSVRASFQGTGISVILYDPGIRNYYNIILDGSVISRMQTKEGLNTYKLANALKDTIHEIEIFRLTEEMFGKTQFRGFLLDKGKTLVEISGIRYHLIEFIGNSITCGYGNEGVNGKDSFGPTTENHYLTYATITSRSLNARHLPVCKSGIGIYRNYDGPVTGSEDCMSNYYTRTYLYDQLPLYGFKDKPDLVCIDLGTNDFSTNKGDPERFKNTYLRFIDSIQLKDKSADILCLIGPMLSGTSLTNMRSYLHSVVDSANKKNNGKVYFFEMSEQKGSLGIDFHPTVAQHLKNAKELIQYISTLKGWQVIPKAILGNTGNGDEIIINFNSELKDSTGMYTGFSVSADNINIPVSSVMIDAADKSKVHIMLSAPVAPGQKINVSYLPGSISGKDTVPLEKIYSLNIQNLLTETKLTKAVIDNTGSKVSLTFNKSIITPDSTQGILIIDDKSNVYGISSFKSGNTYLELVMSNKLKAHTSYFVSISAAIQSKDKVVVSPLSRFPITNSSVFTSVEESHVPGLLIYPNPSGNKILNYRFEGGISGKTIACLFDLQGKLITSRELKNEIGVIDFNNPLIQSGSYILRYNLLAKEYSTLVVL